MDQPPKGAPYYSVKDDTFVVIVSDSPAPGYRWNDKKIRADGSCLRWCTFNGNAWGGLNACGCHPSFMADFPDPAAMTTAFILGGRQAVHVIEQELLITGHKTKPRLRTRTYMIGGPEAIAIAIAIAVLDNKKPADHQPV